MLLRLLQSKKAESPMLVTLSEIATLVDAVGVAPEMLPVPAARCAEVGYGFRATAVDENDAVWVAGISVQLGQRIRRIGITAAVLDDAVIVDDVVES